jgi:hypothetical protein
LLATAALVAWTAPVSAAGYPWRDHVAPFDFLFGNEIDTHQQSHQVGGDSRIQGFLYIHYTGEIIDGIPVGEHTDCGAMPEACVAGWSFNGVRAEGTFIAHDGLPLFCVDAQTVRRKRGDSHFHWLGDPAMGMGLVPGQTYDGYLIRLVAHDTFYFRHHDDLTLVTSGIDTLSHANVEACGP